MEFLKYRGDQEIIQFFENGKVVGNFLRKYTPKLYQNEEFEVELINYITMVQQSKEEVFNNGRTIIVQLPTTQIRNLYSGWYVI